MSIIAEIIWSVKNIIIGILLIALAAYSYSISGGGQADASFSVAIGIIGGILIFFDLLTK